MDFECIDKKALSSFKARLDDAYRYLSIEDAVKQKEELTKSSESQDFWDDSDNATSVLRKINKLKNKIDSYNKCSDLLNDIFAAYDLSQEDDSFAQELVDFCNSLEMSLEELEIQSWFSGEFDSQDAILSINPGSGGKEAQDWTEMLYKMYCRFAQSQGWKQKTLQIVPGDGIGLDKVVVQFSGDNAYGMLKSEHGVHRLVRISPTDEKKRRHTTFAGVEVLPLLPDDIEIDVEDKDIRIDVYRSSGPGGQSVNTTDSAVRITHVPTGIVVTCQNEKSQIQNREMAMKVLKSKLYEIEKEKRSDKINEISGGKSLNSFGSQIRNYVLYPYTLVKDLRSGYETGNVDAVLNGEIKDFLISYHKHINSKHIS